MMSDSILLLFLVGPIILLQLALFIGALVSLLKKDVQSGDKVIWLLVILFANILGSILYFVIGSKMLDEKIERERDKN